MRRPVGKVPEVVEESDGEDADNRSGRVESQAQRPPREQHGIWL